MAGEAQCACRLEGISARDYISLTWRPARAGKLASLVGLDASPPSAYFRLPYSGGLLGRRALARDARGRHFDAVLARPLSETVRVPIV
jgi:hypothetical protein